MWNLVVGIVDCASLLFVDSLVIFMEKLDAPVHELMDLRDEREREISAETSQDPYYRPEDEQNSFCVRKICRETQLKYR